MGNNQGLHTTANYEVNTIFNNTREFLLKEESDSENNGESKVINCPEVEIKIENCPVIALIDTGSRITRISESIYNKFFNHFKTCASFPLIEVQASGFTGEKSVRLKKQFRAQVTLGTWKGELDFLIIPKLVRECILGAHLKLKLIIDLDHRIISLENLLDPAVKNTMSLATEQEIHRITVEWQDSDDFLDLDEKGPIPTSDEITDEEIEGKLLEVDDITDAQKQRLRDLIYKYKDIFRKAPGRFKFSEYKLEFQDENPYFFKSYPIPLKHLAKVDSEIDRMLKYDII